MEKCASIIVVAGQYSFLGTIDNRTIRVMEVLNEANTEFVRLRGVTVHRNTRADCVDQIEEVVIPKANIDFVTLTEQHHEAPLRRHYALVEKPCHTASVVIAQYEIRGGIWIKGRPDAIVVLGREAPMFFPITEAEISRDGSRSSQFPTGVALVHKARVSMLHITAR